MSFRNFITESIMLPLSDIAVGHSISKQLKFLNRSQWWSEEELIEYQNKKLRELINHSYHNVPYYKEVMDERGLTPKDINTINDLKKLPALTKEMFKDNYPHKLRALNWRKHKTLYNQSSGSTGTPIQYVMTRTGYGLNKACYLRGWYWMGFRLGDKLVKISQNERNSFEKKIQDKIDNTLLFSAKYSKENLDVFLKVINKFKPKFLRSYPDPLHFISLMLKDESISIRGLKAINTTGNILFPEVRSLIEEKFGVKIFDSYNCEGGPNFFECPTHECYHSSMEYGISEILDDNLNEVNNGEMGRLYTTDLWNYVAPFIRYDSADLVEKSQEPCSCGRKLLSIKKIIGRDNDVIIAPNGKILIAQTFTTYFKYFPAIKQFQIFQESIDILEIRLKTVTGKLEGEAEKAIISYWSEYVNNTMKIKISILEDIPLLSSGKRRFLIRDKSIPFKV